MSSCGAFYSAGMSLVVAAPKMFCFSELSCGLIALGVNFSRDYGGSEEGEGDVSGCCSHLGQRERMRRFVRISASVLMKSLGAHHSAKSRLHDTNGVLAKIHKKSCSGSLHSHELFKRLSTGVVQTPLAVKASTAVDFQLQKVERSCSSRDEPFRLRRFVLGPRLATSREAAHTKGQRVLHWEFRMFDEKGNN